MCQTGQRQKVGNKKDGVSPFYSGADYEGSRQVAGLAGGRQAGGWSSRAYVATLGWQVLGRWWMVAGLIDNLLII